MIIRKDIYRPWRWKTIFQTAMKFQIQQEVHQREQLLLRAQIHSLAVDKQTLESDLAKVQMENQKAKEQMTGLLRWIYVTHHLEGPFLEGAVRNVLNKKR